VREITREGVAGRSGDQEAAQVEDLRRIIDRMKGGESLIRDDVTALLMAKDPTSLFAAADETRERYVGNAVHLRGIIEFSNFCIKNCLYCGLRRGNRTLERYRMTPTEIMETAHRGAQAGIKTVVLQSGEDPFYTVKILSDIVARLKSELRIAVTLSVGDRAKKEYRLLKESGADRYLLKQETADPELFARLRPGTTLEGRKRRLRWLKELGYQVGSGGMVGLPGQTVETIADDIMLLAELNVEMAGIGPFIPNGDTPLADCRGGSAELALRAVAVTRVVLPYANLPATTSLATVHPEGRQLALTCGANVIMPDITPFPYKKLYEIYPNKSGVEDDGIVDSIPRVTAMIQAMGRTVAVDYGHGQESRK
jgi:biotin synthase